MKRRHRKWIQSRRQLHSRVSGALGVHRQIAQLPADQSDIRGAAGSVTIPYDYLVYAVGTENQTFGIEGVPKYACFLKELSDADKIRTKLMDCEFPANR